MIRPGSRFAGLPLLAAPAASGEPRRAIALPLDPAPPPPAGTLAPYVMREGDTLDALARARFGDERLWWRIADVNPVVYPLDLAAGDVISIPLPGPATRITRARTF